jgi:hypothetical protein
MRRHCLRIAQCSVVVGLCVVTWSLCHARTETVSDLGLLSEKELESCRVGVPGGDEDPLGGNECCQPPRRWGCLCKMPCGSLEIGLACPLPGDFVNLACDNGACNAVTPPQTGSWCIFPVATVYRYANMCKFTGGIHPCVGHPDLCPPPPGESWQCNYLEIAWDNPVNSNQVLVNICSSPVTCPVSYHVCDL